ncbi:hypothetical protein D3C71_2017000 [compost metagenome]
MLAGLKRPTSSSTQVMPTGERDPRTMPRKLSRNIMVMSTVRPVEDKPCMVRSLSILISLPISMSSNSRRTCSSRFTVNAPVSGK